jgi:hypothetical protein
MSDDDKPSAANIQVRIGLEAQRLAEGYAKAKAEPLRRRILEDHSTRRQHMQAIRKALLQLAWEAEGMTGMEASRRIHDLAMSIDKPRPRGRPAGKR